MILTHLVLFSFFGGASAVAVKTFTGVHLASESLTTPSVVSESIE